MRPLDRPFVDVCLTGRPADRPVRLEWPASGVAVSLRADDVFSHTVFYVPLRKRYFAVEPVTHANDGFNLMAAGVDGHGVFVLGPGESRGGDFHLDVDHP
jgi:aldose 1-epimerase